MGFLFQPGPPTSSASSPPSSSAPGRRCGGANWERPAAGRPRSFELFGPVRKRGVKNGKFSKILGFFWPVFGGFSPETDPKTLEIGLSAKSGAECTQNQPRRPIPMPFRGVFRCGLGGGMFTDAAKRTPGFLKRTPGSFKRTPAV